MNAAADSVLLSGGRFGAPTSEAMTMKSIRTRVCSVLSAAAIAGGVPAQEKPPAAVEKLLVEIDAALGLPSAAPRARKIEGDYSIVFDGQAGGKPIAEGAFREFYAGDDRARHVSGMGSYGNLERGVQQDLVWEVDPAMGAKVHRAHHGDAVRRFYGVMGGVSPRVLYAAFERVDDKVVDGVKCRVLRMTPKKGKPDTWCVDEQGRVVQFETALPAPESSAPETGLDDLMPAVVTFSDWRAVGAAQVPFVRRMKMGPAIISFVCKTVSDGAALDAKTFAPPEAVSKVEVKTAEPAFGDDGKPNYQVVERPEQLVASIRVTCKAKDLSKQLAGLLPEVMAHITATGTQMGGAPFTRYHKIDGDTMDIEVGIPITAKIEEGDRVKNGKLPKGRVATAWHVGPYDKLKQAHEGLMAFAKAEKLEATGGPWEIYWTDPGMVPDPQKWRTQLFLPVK